MVKPHSVRTGSSVDASSDTRVPGIRANTSYAPVKSSCVAFSAAACRPRVMCELSLGLRVVSELGCGEISGRCRKRRGQCAEEGDDLAALGLREVQWLQLAASKRCLRGRAVVLEHIGQRRELARMHVWRTIDHVAQRWWLVGAHELRSLGDREAELRTAIRYVPANSFSYVLLVFTS